MSGLPEMVYRDGITKRGQVKFGGYNHTPAAQDGELWDMRNLSSEYYPLLSPRGPRRHLRQVAKANGFYVHDGLYWVDGTNFFANGETVGTVSDGKKVFASLGAYIVIFPDKAYYNRLTGEFGSMESQVTASVKFQNGTYAGEAAEGNTVLCETTGFDWGDYFRAGDGVTITGASVEGNNKTAVIREIDGGALRFYENCFETGNAAQSVTVKRAVPDMDFLCENENRLWGCKGDMIYACKQGDIFNWNVFDGVATDSYAADVASTGDFTACASYLGYPCFFKEEHIYKVYGDRPSNFQVMGSASMGVMKGSGGSLAIAGEQLFYLSTSGAAVYTGGMPKSLAAPFGSVKYKNAVGGSDGRRYFISMEDDKGFYSLFVYDTECGLWHREDETEAVGFGREGADFYCLEAGGVMWQRDSEGEIEAEKEGVIESMAEFGDFVDNDPNHKGTAKLQIRCELDEGAWIKISLMFDSDGEWKNVWEMEATRKCSRYIPIIPRREDHFRLKIEGRGMWRIYSLVRESYGGSEIGGNSAV